jgi:hypothetical protein
VQLLCHASHRLGGLPDVLAGVELRRAVAAARQVEAENARRIASGEAPLWELATQPVMYLIFNRDVAASVDQLLDPGWN